MGLSGEVGRCCGAFARFDKYLRGFLKGFHGKEARYNLWFLAIGGSDKCSRIERTLDVIVCTQYE